MERRLVPVNAILAMLGHPGTSWPRPLRESGYSLAGLEVPCSSEQYRVVADVIAFNESTNQFLAMESKSGANVDDNQARRYLRVDGDDLIRKTSVTVRTAAPSRVHIIYACLMENLDRIRMGLDSIGTSFTVFGIGTDAVVARHGASVDSDLVDQLPRIFSISSPPPAVIKVDPESSNEAFDRLVIPRLISALSYSEQSMRISTLADQCVPYLHLASGRHRNALQKRFDESARRICAKAPEDFAYRRKSQMAEFATIQFLYPTEDGDRRGRTAKYQALRRRLLDEPEHVSIEPRQGSLFQERELDAEMDSIDYGLSEPNSDMLELEES